MQYFKPAATAAAIFAAMSILYMALSYTAWFPCVPPPDTTRQMLVEIAIIFFALYITPMLITGSIYFFKHHKTQPNNPTVIFTMDYTGWKPDVAEIAEIVEQDELVRAMAAYMTGMPPDVSNMFYNQIEALFGIQITELRR